ncbi:hypothetical protein ABPG72_006646 [Tetrahymena utriculariae]
MKQCIKFLNKRHKFIKQYFISNRLVYNHQVTQKQDIKCLYYEIQKAISQNYKNGINVTFLDQYTHECTCKLKLLAIEEEYIHYQAVHCISTQIVPKDGISIFFGRYNNGFLFSEATCSFLNRMKNYQYNQYKSEMLQIVSYDKYIKPHMTINPQIILYELIE